MFRPSLFKSFFMGGFECSSHRRSVDRTRLDMLASTGHADRAAEDYRLLQRHGLHAARDGLRWHLVETSPGVYDWSSFLPMLRAARDTGQQVVWDILHYGWPDDLDPFEPRFIDRFAAFAGAAARVVRSETDGVPFWAPVNEMSFLAWGGGDVGYLNPFARGRGTELKVQLARASVAAGRAVRAVDPRARLVHPEPVIRVIPHPGRPADELPARRYTEAQFDAWEMLAGCGPWDAGGEPALLDVVGVNYYWNNQWLHHGFTVDIGNPLYKPFRELLAETHQRLRRPMFIAETGCEGERRPAWLAYIGEEVRAAIRMGVPVEGICLYPVVSHVGWDNLRYCPNGLFDVYFRDGERPAEEAYAAEVARQVELFRLFFEAREGAAEERRAA